MDDRARSSEVRTWSWRVPLSTLAGLGAVEADVQRLLDEERLDAHASYVTRVVIEEVVANLVAHGSPGPDAHATVSVTIGPSTSTVTVVDEAAPFDPQSAPELDVTADLGSRRAGGMGLHLVRHLVDALRYEQVDGRNRLVAVVQRR